MTPPSLQPGNVKKGSADSPQDAPETTILVTEIYRSVQGESTWAGRPCTCIRLTVCNLRCVWL